jgi:hypothetical protein
MIHQGCTIEDQRLFSATCYNSLKNAMATPPAPFDGDESLFDSAQPFKGVVVCCTSIPAELRVSCQARPALSMSNV